MLKLLFSASPSSAPTIMSNIDLNRSNNNISSTPAKKDKEKKSKDGGKKKLTKADIGTPSNFVYVILFVSKVYIENHSAIIESNKNLTCLRSYIYKIDHDGLTLTFHVGNKQKC